MSIDTILSTLMSDIPKCVAAGVVDLDSGMLLGIKTVDSHPSAVIDLLAPATKDLYEGDNVVAIENLFKKARGMKSNEHYFQQMIIYSTNLLHFFGRLKANPSIVVVAVTDAGANVGMVLAKAKAVVEDESV